MDAPPPKALPPLQRLAPRGTTSRDLKDDVAELLLRQYIRVESLAQGGVFSTCGKLLQICQALFGPASCGPDNPVWVHACRLFALGKVGTSSMPNSYRKFRAFCEQVDELSTETHSAFSNLVRHHIMAESGMVTAPAYIVAENLKRLLDLVGRRQPSGYYRRYRTPALGVSLEPLAWYGELVCESVLGILDTQWPEGAAVLFSESAIAAEFDAGVTPKSFPKMMIQGAIPMGNVGVVRYLLTLPNAAARAPEDVFLRADVLERQGLLTYAISRQLQGDQLAMAKLLLDDPNVPITPAALPAAQPIAISWMVEDDHAVVHTDMLRMALRHPRVTARDLNASQWPARADGLHSHRQRTPLATAAVERRVDAVRLLLADDRVRPNAPSGDPDGYTALHRAVRTQDYFLTVEERPAVQRERLELIGLMLADPRVDVDVRSEVESETVLMAAHASWDEERMELLLRDPRIRKTINYTNHLGYTVLDLARMWNGGRSEDPSYIEMLRLLRSYGAVESGAQH